MCPSSYGCTREVTKEALESHRRRQLLRVTLASRLHRNFPSASRLDRCTPTMKQLLYNIDNKILWNFSFPNHWNLTDIHFDGFTASSACVRKTLEHANDVSKPLAWKCVTLLAVINGIFYFCWPWTRGGPNLRCDACVFQWSTHLKNISDDIDFFNSVS